MVSWYEVYYLIYDSINKVICEFLCDIDEETLMKLSILY